MPTRSGSSWLVYGRQVFVHAEPGAGDQLEHDGLSLVGDGGDTAEFRLGLDVVAEHGHGAEDLDAPVGGGAAPHPEAAGLPLGPELLVRGARLEPVIDVVEKAVSYTH